VVPTGTGLLAVRRASHRDSSFEIHDDVLFTYAVSATPSLRMNLAADRTKATRW
jgi:hypothetical protein